MEFLVMSLFDAGVSTAGAIGGSMIDGVINSFFGGRNEERSNRRSEAMSRRMMNEEALLNAKYYRDFYNPMNRSNYQWQRDIDYGYDSQQYYDLARQYAENSAKWQVQGLRNANLNPILAATDGNFRGTFGNGPSSVSMPSSGSGSSVHPSMRSAGSGASVNSNVLEGIRDVSSASLAETNAKTAEQMRDPTVNSAKADVSIKEATADKIRAEAKNVEANTARTILGTDNDSRNGGLNGPSGLLQRWTSNITETAKELGIFDHDYDDGDVIKLDDGKAKGSLPDSGHSAKDEANQKRVQDALHTNSGIDRLWRYPAHEKKVHKKSSFLWTR